MTENKEKLADETQVEAEKSQPESAKAPKEEKFLFADEGLTVHVLMDKKALYDILTKEDILYDVKSKVLAPGDIVALDELPPYLLKDLKDGKVSGARIVGREEAQRLNQEAAHIKALADKTIGVESDMITEVIS